jgi:hypothetical protein
MRQPARSTEYLERVNNMSKLNTVTTETPMTADEILLARIAELEYAQVELKRLKEEAKTILRMKVSQKGAVSIYGMRRVPITLYANEIRRIVAELIDTGRLNTFIEDNQAELSSK